MHTLLKLLMVVLLCGLWVGCGGGSGEVTTPDKREGPSAPTNQAAAAGSSNYTASSMNQRTQRRNLPAAAVGGGGGGSMQAATPPSGGNNTASGSTDGAGNVASASTGPFTAETKENGLFPQMPGSGNATAGFGGALFPTATTGGGSGTAGSIGNFLSRLTGGGPGKSEPKATVTPEGGQEQGMMDQAIKQFSELGDEQIAVQSLYTHILSNPGAMRKYPLMWYSGISQPRVMFRWGIGVVYMEPSAGLDGRHPVLGDPGGDSGSGGGGGGFDGGNTGLEGGDGPPPGAGGNATASERKYKDVNTARPDGCVLYYTGEMGEMVIEALDKRRRHGDAFYGELLKDVPIHQPTEPIKQTAANTNSGGGSRSGSGQSGSNTKKRNLPGAAVGGGGGASQPVEPPSGFGGATPPGNAAGGDAETASSGPKEAPARVLDRAMGSGESAKPDPNMTGTIIPGVMLVGVGKKAALVEKAKRMGLDALIVFNVNVSKTRSSGKTSSLTKMTIINLQDSDNEVVYNSKALKDTIVADQKEKGMTPVKSAVDAAFKSNADLQFKAAELPGVLTDDKEKGMEHVKKRVDKLVENPGNHPLPVAIEILNWRQQGLVDDQLAIDSLNKIFGDDTIGSILVSGDQRACAKAIAAWVSQSGTHEEDDDL